MLKARRDTRKDINRMARHGRPHAGPCRELVARQEDMWQGWWAAQGKSGDAKAHFVGRAQLAHAFMPSPSAFRLQKL